MHELVSNYISEKEEEKRKKYEKEKREFLRSKDFYEVVYSDKVEYNRDYPYQEFNEETKTIRWFQKNLIEVTDEEYEKLKSYEETVVEYSQNKIAVCIRVFAWLIIIGGCILGIILSSDFNNYVMFIYCPISIITGIFILGFAEIIVLLDKINQKTNK